MMALDIQDTYFFLIITLFTQFTYSIISELNVDDSFFLLKGSIINAIMFTASPPEPVFLFNRD